jgi:hypothetical protein
LLSRKLISVLFCPPQKNKKEEEAFFEKVEFYIFANEKNINLRHERRRIQ